MFEFKPIFKALFRSKVGPLLLLVQVAITTAIVSNAAYIIQDQLAYLKQSTGYKLDEVFSFTVMTFGTDRNLAEQLELDEQMLRQIPGVISATSNQAIPLSGGGSSTSFRLKPEPEQSRSVQVAYYYADEHALDTFGVELIEGRNFRHEEVVISKNFLDNGPSTCIISKDLANELFEGKPALGKRVYLGTRALEIIGIVDTMKSPWPSDYVKDSTAIVPYINAQKFQHMMVRTEAGMRDSIMRDIEDIMLKAYDKRVIISLRSLDETKSNYDEGKVLVMRMLGILIVILVLVTALGIFGLTQFNISKRTKQIGTRRALGARKSAIVRYFLIENAYISLSGLALGCTGAVYFGRGVMQVFSIEKLDPYYIAGTALFIFIVSIIAVIIPALKAANISPSIATRSI